MNLKVNQDGKLWDRIVGAAIPVAISLMIGGIVWWSDSRTVDARTADALRDVKERIEKVEIEAREARQAAAADRQKTAELAGDVRNVLRSTARIEALLDRILMDRKAAP